MDANRVDLNKIAIFCQVVECGNNYQRASEVLNVSPSALSQTISGLEFSLGFQLFDRLGKKLVPTKRGLRIHSEFRASQTNFIKALNELSGADKRVAGLLRVGSYLEFAKSQLSGSIADFIRTYPEAQIKMVFDTPSRLHEMLNQGQLDLCFSIFPSVDKKMILSQSVCQEELVLIARKNQVSETPSYEEVMSQPIIEYYFNHQPICRWLAVHFNKRPKKVPARILASTAEMVLSLVREGAGIGIVPAYLVTDAETLKTLRIVRPTQQRLDDDIGLLERVSEQVTPLHRAFKQLCLENFGKNPVKRSR